MKTINIEKFMGKPSKIIKLKAGLWDYDEVQLKYNYPICLQYSKIHCSHLGKEYIVKKTNKDGSFNKILYADCPRVIEAYNEGGQCSTGVCLDCILDAIKLLNNKK